MVNPIFKINEEKREQGYVQFVVEPLEPGFGNTLGVALRRVLLSDIPGAAITSVKIEGVKHMYSSLPGLKEDIIEFILNLKTLRVKLPEDVNEAHLRLTKTGPGDITGADVEAADGAEIVNPDHYIGSLSNNKSKIEMEMTVERGYGYSLAEERNISTVGVMPIDAIFSPIQRVNYRVEQTRVGRQTNYDRLILEVWSDGTIDPREALDQSSKTLVAYFKQVFNPDAQETESTEAETTTGSAISDDVMRMTVDELDLPTRIYNSLRNAGIETVGQLLSTPRRELMQYRNLGAKSMSVIDESLKAKGISTN